MRRHSDDVLACQLPISGQIAFPESEGLERGKAIMRSLAGLAAALSSDPFYGLRFTSALAGVASGSVLLVQIGCAQMARRHCGELAGPAKS